MERTQQKLKMDQSERRVKEAMNRIQGTIENTITVQNNINQALHSDHQKLVGIHKNLNQIDQKLQKTNYIADGMMSLWTRIKHKLTGGFKYKKDETIAGPTISENKKSELVQGQNRVNIQYTKNQSTDDTLDHLNNRMQILKVAGMKTSNTLDEQKKMLQIINAKTDKNINGMSDAYKKTKKLLDK